MFNFLKQIVCLVLVSVFLLKTFNTSIVLANYHINKDYIAKVLCVNKSKPQMHCNGKCHLKNELNKTEKKEHSPANPVTEKSQVQLFSESNSTFDLLNTVILNPNKLLSNCSFHLSEKHLDSVFHPPQV